jgi:hypothetical protein
MRRTPLTAMLTLVAALASTCVVAGCGGEAGSSSSAKPAPTSTPTTTTAPHKHNSKPAY